MARQVASNWAIRSSRSFINLRASLFSSSNCAGEEGSDGGRGGGGGEGAKTQSKNKTTTMQVL
jgi:hypothetical protein